MRTTRHGCLVVTLVVMGITLSACGSHGATGAIPTSASSPSAAASLPPSTDPAPWADASTTVPTVTTTTISVVTPFTADAIAPIGSGITLSSSLGGYPSNPASTESATFRFRLTSVIDPMTAGDGWPPPRAPLPGHRWVLLKFTVTNVATSPGVYSSNRGGLFVWFTVEPDLTNGSGRSLYSSVDQGVQGWHACGDSSLPTSGTTKTICQPFEIPVGLPVRRVAVLFGFMTGTGPTPNQLRTGEWVVT